jgi:acetylornithine/succinyldiaminopimelate/putrescine aminotransferase
VTGQGSQILDCSCGIGTLALALARRGFRVVGSDGSGGCVMLKEITKKGILKRVRERGAYLEKKLKALKARFPVMKEIRGKGMLLGARIVGDPAPIIAKCKDLGLLLIKAEHHTIRFMPPLIVNKAEIDTAAGIFEKALVAQP